MVRIPGLRTEQVKKDSGMHFAQPEIVDIIARYTGTWTNYAVTIRRVCEDTLALHHALENSHARVRFLEAQLASLENTSRSESPEEQELFT